MQGLKQRHMSEMMNALKMKDLKEPECMLELAPSGFHRRHLAEIGIKLCKNHFLSILLDTKDSFPVYFCDKLLS